MGEAVIGRWIATVRAFGRMVKFSHSIFALPFGLSGAVLAASGHGIEPRQLLWIVVAMVGARNAAMAFNRLADEPYDALNPRTSGRELPQRRLSRRAVWFFTCALAALFVWAAFQLNRLCGWLSPVALALIFGYSYSKRFTWWSHAWLGLCLAMAPVGAWVAVRGSFGAPAWWLALAVAAWVSGFDILYACQDAAFDRQVGLRSIPARFGVPAALRAARGLHAAALAALGAVGLAMPLHPVYWLGLGGVALTLAWEHRLVSPQDLSQLGRAFFDANAVISLLYLGTALAAVWLGPAGG